MFVVLVILWCLGTASLLRDFSVDRPSSSSDDVFFLVVGDLQHVRVLLVADFVGISHGGKLIIDRSAFDCPRAHVICVDAGEVRQLLRHRLLDDLGIPADSLLVVLRDVLPASRAVCFVSVCGPAAATAEEAPTDRCSSQEGQALPSSGRGQL